MQRAKFVIKKSHENIRLSIPQWNSIFKVNFLEKTPDDITLGELIELFSEEIRECIDVPAHQEIYKVPNPVFVAWKAQSTEYCGVEKPEDLSDTNFRSLITAKFRAVCPNIRDKYLEIMDWITQNPKPEAELAQFRDVPRYYLESQTHRDVLKIIDTIEAKFVI